MTPKRRLKNALVMVPGLFLFIICLLSEILNDLASEAAFHLGQWAD